MQKGRHPRRGGVAQAEAYMWYALHCAIPPQRRRSDFLRRHQSLVEQTETIGVDELPHADGVEQAAVQGMLEGNEQNGL